MSTPSNELKQILDEIEEKRRNAWRYTDNQLVEDFILYEAAALVKALRRAITTLDDTATVSNTNREHAWAQEALSDIAATLNQGRATPK
jgi:hypothetical protein